MKKIIQILIVCGIVVFTGVDGDALTKEFLESRKLLMSMEKSEARKANRCRDIRCIIDGIKTAEGIRISPWVTALSDYAKASNPCGKTALQALKQVCMVEKNRDICAGRAVLGLGKRKDARWQRKRARRLRVVLDFDIDMLLGTCVDKCGEAHTNIRDEWGRNPRRACFMSTNSEYNRRSTLPDAIVKGCVWSGGREFVNGKWRMRSDGWQGFVNDKGEQKPECLGAPGPRR